MHSLLTDARTMLPELRTLRHTLHEHAEVGFHLPATFKLVTSWLEAIGLTPTPCGTSGITAVIPGASPGKTILLRADMDALPIQENTGLPYACTTGAMHACGHDLHTAMLLGAAKLLNERRTHFPGNVKLMFQPAEERLEGAAHMIEAGVLESPTVAASVMPHVLAGVPFPTGTVLVSAPGVGAPSADFFRIVLRGKGCHGSSPHAGIDPLLPAAHLLSALPSVTARELSPSENAVLTVGHLTGTTAANVIPDCVELSGTLRTVSETTRDYLLFRLRQMTEGIASAFRVEGEVRIDSSCPTLINDKALSETAYNALKQLLPTDHVYLTSDPAISSGGSALGRGSEDFSYVSHRVPSLMLAIAAGNPDSGFTYPLHHPSVRFDDDALSYGAATLAQVAMEWLHTSAVPQCPPQCP